MFATRVPNKPISSIVYVAALTGVTLLVYWQVATFGFINLDDAYYVYRNNNVRTGLALDNFLWSLTATDVGLWQPLVWISYQLESAVFGPGNPQARHAVNLLLHCGNVLLVFYFAKWLFGEAKLGFFVALLFALHPQHVQSVAWIAQRKDVLSAFFFLACLLFYAKLLRGESKRIRKNSWYSLALISFLFALMCKPSVVSLPGLLLLLDYWHTKRINPVSQIRLSKRLMNKTPFVLVAVIVAGVTLQLKHPDFVHSPAFEVDNFSHAASGLLYYTKTFFVPWPLPVLVETPDRVTTSVLLAAIFLITVLAFTAVLIRRACPLFGFGLLWFVAMWFPVSGVVPLGQFYVADRYTYLPHIGLFISLAALLGLFTSRFQIMKAGVIAVVAVSAGIPAIFQVSYWRDAVTLFEREVQIDPANKWGYLYAGESLLARQQTEKAYGYFNRALNIDPQNSMTHEYRGNALREMGDNDEAYQAYRLAIRNKPRRGNAYVGLAQILLEQDDPELARVVLQDGLRRLPGDNGLLNQLGYLHGFVMHDEELAIRYYEQVLRKNPKDVHALHGIGVLSIRIEDNKNGIKHLQKLLTIEPGNETAKAIVRQRGL